MSESLSPGTMSDDERQAVGRGLLAEFASDGRDIRETFRAFMVDLLRRTEPEDARQRRERRQAVVRR